MTNVLFITCPPLWLKLPALSIPYLVSSLSDEKLGSISVIDLNAEIYNLLKRSSTNYAENFYFQNWEKNITEIKSGLYEYLIAIPEINQYLTGIIKNSILKKIDFICFSIFDSNYDFTMKFAGLFKNNRCKAKIIFGGPEITIRTNAAFQNDFETKIPEDAADYLVSGEGESAIKKIINGTAEKKTAFDETENIDSIKFPRFDLFNLKLYKTVHCLPLLMSRGCINKCSFCSEKNLYSNIKYRMHSPEYMIGQIDFFIKKYGIARFIFQDSLINGDLNKLEKFCELLLSKNLNVKWEAQVYIRKDMDLRLMTLMKKSGCYNMFVGLESGSNQILKAMNKRFDCETASEFFLKCKKADLFFEISLILGYPGETMQTINETINFLKLNSKSIPKIAQINPYIFYRFSEVKEREYLNQKEINEKLEIENHINIILETAKNNGIKFTKAFVKNL
ncbi:MAG TPA: radical SAM protein [bacterium]|nr:radical SAM protein [bacterium]HPN31836.1 radical SAM protein [bacterium]